MRSEEIVIGESYTLQIGRNVVPVRVTGTGERGGWTAETQAGRSMTIRDEGRFVARVGEVVPVAMEAAPPSVAAPVPEPTPAPADATSKGPESAPSVETTGSMSILDAAVHLLGQVGTPMGCSELVAQARAQGIWTPRRGGKTPERTLYSAILREIAMKGDASRFRKTARGRFEIRG